MSSFSKAIMEIWSFTSSFCIAIKEAWSFNNIYGNIKTNINGQMIDSDGQMTYHDHIPLSCLQNFTLFDTYHII